MKDCEYYQELISRLADGELNKAEYDSVIAHIEDCPRCSAVFTVFSSLSDIISGDTEPVPGELHENIMAQVRRSAVRKQNNRKKPVISKPLRNVLAAAACAAIVLLAVGNLSVDRKNREITLTSEEAAAITKEAAQNDTATNAAGAQLPPATAEAAAPVMTPAAVQTAAPVQSAENENDIYAGTMQTQPPVSTPRPTATVRQPVTVVTPTPAPVQNNLQPVPTAAPTGAPTPVQTLTPVQTAAPAQSQENTQTSEPASVKEEPEAAVPAEAESAAEAVEEAAVAAPPKMMMAAPQMNAAASEESEEPSETDDTTPQPTASPVPVPVRKARISDKDTEEKLLRLLDGEQEKLPERTASVRYLVKLETKDKSDSARLLTVEIYGDSVFYNIAVLPAETPAPSASPAAETPEPTAAPTAAPSASPTASPTAETAALSATPTVMLKAKCNASDFEEFIAPYIILEPSPTPTGSPSPAQESPEVQ